MKKILLILILVLMAAPVYAFTSAIQGVIAGSYSSGCSNVPATDFVGLAADAGTEMGSPSANYFYCAPYTPTMTCTTGTLDTAYVDKNFTGTVHTKVCLYNRTGNGATEPGDGDTKLYCTDELSDAGAVGIKSVAVSGTVNISSTGTYWVCVVSDATRWDYSRTSDTTNGFYCTAASGGSYASPPDDLDDCANWSAEGQWGMEARFSIK